MRANVSPLDLDQADVTALQQLIVDAYAQIESERLQFLRREQDYLRPDNYKDLQETIVKGMLDRRYFASYILWRPTLHVRKATRFYGVR